MKDVERDGETMGEIVMHGNMVAKGYFDNEEATEEAFEGGWYHSGDVAVWHPDGYIEIRDRDKDIIISGGENISTIEVEQVVSRHPAVMEAAVIAIPDEKWGERPKAFVVLKKDQEATEQEIIDFCKEHIARFKAPAAVEFTELPKTSTGKVQKFVLRDKAWSGKREEGELGDLQACGDFPPPGNTNVCGLSLRRGCWYRRCVRWRSLVVRRSCSWCARSGGGP